MKIYELDSTTAKGFVTPQMFGAVGDGVHDDTEALNNCLRSGEIVFIPSGNYLIKSTLSPYCRDGLTVYCHKRALFIADPSLEGAMLELSQYVGYNPLGLYWFGGIFECSGIENISGIIINDKAKYCTLDNINIVNIGNNSIGLNLSKIGTAKVRLENIACYGASYNYVASTGEPSIGIKSHNLDRNNIGILIDTCYDMSIGTIYSMCCRTGLKSIGSEQVHIDFYHCWIGAIGTNEKYDYADYVKGVGLEASGYLHFNQLYIDQYYKGFKARILNADVMHYICPRNDGVIVFGENPVQCFIGELTDKYGQINLKNVSVNKNGDTVAFNGLDGTTERSAWVRDSVMIDFAYDHRATTLKDPFWAENNTSSAITLNIEHSPEWHLLGWIYLGGFGVLDLEINELHNSLVGEVKIYAKDYLAHIMNAKSYSAYQTNKVHIGLGNVFEENGYKWQAVLIKNDCSFATEYYIRPRNTLRFIRGDGSLYKSPVKQEVMFVDEKPVDTESGEV